MALDPSIALQVKLPQIASPYEVQGNALKMRAAQREEQEALRAEDERVGTANALKSFYTGGQDRQALEKDLAGRGLAGKIPALQKQFSEADALKLKARADQLDQHFKELELGARLMSGARDQASYDAVKQQAAGILGADRVANWSPVYNPQEIESNRMKALSVIEQMKAERDKIDDALKIAPKGSIQDMGGGLQSFSTDPLTGKVTAGPMVGRKTLTPGEISSAAVQREGFARADAREARAASREEAKENRTVDRNLLQAGYRRTEDGNLEAIPGGPAALKTASGKKLSAKALDELYNTDEKVRSVQNAKMMLDEAKSLSDKAYSGKTAGARAYVASQTGLGMGFSTPDADATLQLDNLMTGQMLETLRASFAGNPTEGERKVLLDFQASSKLTPENRAKLLERALSALDRREKFEASKAKAIRKGTYTDDGYDPNATQAEPVSAPAQKAAATRQISEQERAGAPRIKSKEELDKLKLPSGSVFIDPTGTPRTMP